MNTKQRYQRITSKKNNRPTEKRNNRTKKRKNKSKVKFKPGKTRKKNVRKMRKRSNKNNLKLIGGTPGDAPGITSVREVLQNIPMLGNQELRAQYERRRKRYIYRMLCKLCSRVTGRSTTRTREIKVYRNKINTQLNMCFYRAYVTIFNHPIIRENDMAMDSLPDVQIGSLPEIKKFSKVLNISVIKNMPILKQYYNNPGETAPCSIKFEKESLPENNQEILGIIQRITGIDDINIVKRYYLLGMFLLINCIDKFIQRFNIESSYVNDFNFFTKSLSDNPIYLGEINKLIEGGHLDTLLRHIPDNFQDYFSNTVGVSGTLSYTIYNIIRTGESPSDISLSLQGILADYLFLKSIHMILCVRDLKIHFPTVTPEPSAADPPAYERIFYRAAAPPVDIDLDDLEAFSEEDILEVHLRPDTRIQQDYLHLGPPEEMLEIATSYQPPPTYIEREPEDTMEAYLAQVRAENAEVFLEERLTQEESLQYPTRGRPRGGGYKNILHGGSGPLKPRGEPTVEPTENPTVASPSTAPKQTTTELHTLAVPTDIKPLKYVSTILLITEKELKQIGGLFKTALIKQIKNKNKNKKIKVESAEKLTQLYQKYHQAYQKEINKKYIGLLQKHIQKIKKEKPK